MRLFTPRDTVILLRTIVITLWPVATLAASQGLGTVMYGISVLDWMSLATLSFVSGLVALLNRIRRSLEAAALISVGRPAIDGDLQRIPWWVFAIGHMAGSMLAGMLAFFFCNWQEWNAFLEAIAIALASYTGARFADQMADGFSDGVIDKMNAVFGKKT